MVDKAIYYLEMICDSETKEVSLKGSAASLANLAQNVLAMTSSSSSTGAHLHYDRFSGLTEGDASLVVILIPDEDIPLGSSMVE